MPNDDEQQADPMRAPGGGAQAGHQQLQQQLQAANEQLNQIFHRAPAFMCVLRGPEHVFEMANARYRQLVGGRELIGKTVRAALPELAGQGVYELLDAVYRSGQAYQGRALQLHLRRDARRGEEQLFLDFAYMALREPGGAISGVLVQGVDVSERRRAKLLAQGQRRALELAVTGAPLEAVLAELARTAEEQSGRTALAAVLLRDAGGAHLRHVAAPSLAPAYVAAVDALPLAADALLADGPVHTAGLASGRLWDACAPLARAHGLHACRALPIVAPSGAVLGAFAWYYRAPREAAPHEHAALALLVNTAALVIGQRQDAAQRRALEQRSRAILESITEGFVAIDPDWTVSYANGAAGRSVGAPPEALVGQAFWDAFPMARGGAVEAGCRRSARERVPVRLEAHDACQASWFEVNSFPMPDGGVGLTFRDVSDRKRAEADLRRLAAVAEQSSDFIGITTPDARATYLNRAGRAMAGVAPDTDITAYGTLDFVAPESRALVREVVLPALKGPAAQWEGELHLRHEGTGAPIPVFYKGFAVRDDDGNNLGLATITRDITEQKRAEDALRQVAADLSEADRRKSEFLATLAHELRNPLAPIRTGLDLLRHTGGDAAATASVHAMMERQLGQLVHLVDDLLDVARITRGRIDLRKERIALPALVAMAVETSAALIEAGGLRLEVYVPEYGAELCVDTTRIVQVLSNLLNNAAKYTPRGGRITLSAWREDDEAVLAVADSGVGIPQAELETVFEMFTQVGPNMERAQGGLGIGLSLVRQLVELHGGKVNAASDGPGMGSTFTLRLPLSDAPAVPPPPLGGRGAAQGAWAARASLACGAAEAAATPAPPFDVLVVDDNVDAAESLAALLAAMGHRTRVALDGVEGFELARRHRPDLVFLDIGLPGMNGHEVARALRQTPGLDDLAIVAVTGWGERSDLELSVQAGFDRHLTKPVDFTALEQVLAELATRGVRG
ncbi:MAG: PAS domain-containing protein [Pseudomonadota bacterium]